MATVTVTYQYDSGATVEATVEVADSYPDSLDQAKVTAVAALRDTMASFEGEASE